MHDSLITGLDTINYGMNEFTEHVSLASNVLTIGASSLALYLYFFKRNQITSAFKLLLNFAFRMTLGELIAKLDRLNDFSLDDQKGRKEILGILGEICGQMKGNRILANQCKNQIKEIKSYINGSRSITDADKRSLIWELREILRDIEVEAEDKAHGGKK